MKMSEIKKLSQDELNNKVNTLKKDLEKSTDQLMIPQKFLKLKKMWQKF